MYFSKQVNIIMEYYNYSAITLAQNIGVTRQTIYNLTSTSAPQNVKTKNLDSLCQLASVSYNFFEKQDVTLSDFFKCSLQYIINNFSKLDNNIAELIKYNVVQLSGIELQQLPYTEIDDNTLEKVRNIALTIYKLYEKN